MHLPALKASFIYNLRSCEPDEDKVVNPSKL